jgi:hypothetical protein
MYDMHSDMAKLMANQLQPKVKARVILDSAEDGASQGASDYATADLRLKAGAVVQQWIETGEDELADNETLADRLLAMIIGVADADKDGELSEDESAVCEEVANAVWDYLLSKGVSDEDCNALLNDWNGEAAARIKDVVAEGMPEGDEASAADLDAFAFDSDSEASVFDSAGHLILDATYKKKVAVRNGKKVRINKRISGHVRLSAKQKVSIRKMVRKSHSAVATMHRMKSMKIRRRAGL